MERMRSASALFLAALLASPLAGATPSASDKNLARFAESPTATSLKTIQEACSAKELSDDALEAALRRMKNHPTLLRIRALIYIRMHCADTALTEELNGLLGVQYATKNASPLIQALTFEGAPRALLLELGRTEGSTGRSPFLECDRSCLPKVEKFFNQKIQALRYFKYNDKESEVQKMFVQGALDAIEDWRKRNPAE